MQIRILNFMEDKVHHHLVATGIRLCYLISNKVQLAGNIHMASRLHEMSEKANIAGKVTFIKKHAVDLPGDFDSIAAEVIYLHRQSKKTVNRTKEMIVLLKKGEKMINNLFDTLFKKFVDNFAKLGLMQVYDMEDKPGFEIYHVSYPRPELNHDGYNSVSELLLTKYENETPSPLQFLNYNSFDPEFKEQHKGELPPVNEFTDNGFLVPFIRLNTFHLFSVADLDSLRLQFNASIDKLGFSFDHFLSLITKPAEAFQYLNNELRQEASEVETALNNSEIIRNYKNEDLFSTGAVQLMAGLLPWNLVYASLKQTKSVPDASAEVIDNLPQRTELVPVVILNLFGCEDVFLKGKSEQEATEMISLKKSLAL